MNSYARPLPIRNMRIAHVDSLLNDAITIYKTAVYTEHANSDRPKTPEQNIKIARAQQLSVRVVTQASASTSVPNAAAEVGQLSSPSGVGQNLERSPDGVRLNR